MNPSVYCAYKLVVVCDVTLGLTDSQKHFTCFDSPNQACSCKALDTQGGMGGLTHQSLCRRTKPKRPNP